VGVENIPIKLYSYNNMKSDLDALVFPINKWKIVLILIICTFVLVCGIATVIIYINDKLWLILGIFCTLVSGYGTIWSLKLLPEKDALHIDRKGIEYKADFPRQGKINWDEIESIVFHKTYIDIRLFHPEDFVSRQKGLARWLTTSRWSTVGTPVSISLMLFRANEYEIHTYFKKIVDARKYLQEHLP